MRNRKVSLNNFTESLIGISNFKESCFSENNEYKKMLEILVKAIDGELTNRQKECVLMYYGRQMSLKEISSKLNIDQSTISRHLKKSRFKLEKILKYYFNKLNSQN